uniref:Uncharacterized protein n=1 Tax=Physcomitrium patens TaxID=3218 RepID=A0A2K1JH57_PHYPA|nr:hypothetical protein PHYPA_018252 [Physcomitrium patens]
MVRGHLRWNTRRAKIQQRRLEFGGWWLGLLTSSRGSESTRWKAILRW